MAVYDKNGRMIKSEFNDEQRRMNIKSSRKPIKSVYDDRTENGLMNSLNRNENSLRAVFGK